MPSPMKITNANAIREVFSYLVFLGVFWGFVYLVAGTDQFFDFWITSKTQGFFNLIGLILAVIIADRIGSISYWGLSLVALFGVFVMAQVFFFRDYALDADSFSFPPWYTYVFYLAFVSFILFLVRHITKRLSTIRQQAGSTGRSKAAPLN